MDPKLYPSIYNLEDARWTEADRNLSHFFMASWANFAKKGYVIWYYSVLFFQTNHECLCLIVRLVFFKCILV